MQAIAASVSSQARAKLTELQALFVDRAPSTNPETLADFDAAAARAVLRAEHLTREAVDALAPQVRAHVFDGVPVLEVKPKAYHDDGSTVVYIHGGGFVQGSAQSSLLTSALIATTSGRRVISIDYTLAPRGTWRSILQEVVAVWSQVLQTPSTRALGLIGDSAGGCIAAAATLAFRERGLRPPDALILLSPVVDFSDAGDTTSTLASVDYLDPRMREVARRAYAPETDLQDPLVSPVYADFTKGFPPTLLQVGTREMLLSDSVRLHRALRAAGQTSRLELYEGMPHVFQPLLADCPEGQAAWSEMADFWAEHLT